MSDQTPSSVTKALHLLLRLGELGIDGDVRLTDLVAGSGMSKASVFRLLSDLKAAGFVEQDAVTNRYHLGRSVLILASQFSAGADLTVRAAPVMRALSAETGMTVHLSVRDGDRVVWIDKIDGTHGLQLASRIGRSAPVHSTASGKAILAASDPHLVDEIVARGLPAVTPHTITDPASFRAHLQRIRATGYAVDDQENEAGVRCVGAPILGRDGSALGAISISGIAGQVTSADTARLGRIIARAASEISAKFGVGRPAA